MSGRRAVGSGLSLKCEAVGTGSRFVRFPARAYYGAGGSLGECVARSLVVDTEADAVGVAVGDAGALVVKELPD